MDIEQTISELTALPVAVPLQELETVWNSIDSETPISVSPEQREELDRRLDAHEANPNGTLTWDQVLDQLKGKL